MPKSGWVLLGCVVSGLLACGDDEGAGLCPAGGDYESPGDNRVAPEDLCQRLAEIQCASEACCCTTEDRKFGSESACVKEMRAVCLDSGATEDVAKDPRSGFDEDAMEKAFDVLEEYAGVCDPSVVQWGISKDGFGGVLRGSVARDEVCWSPANDGNDAPALLSCKIGDACLPDPGKALGDWKCKPRAKQGETCLGDFSCADGLRCDPHLSSDFTDLGKCLARFGNGEACERPTQCKSLQCKDGKCKAASVQGAYCLNVGG